MRRKVNLPGRFASVDEDLTVRDGPPANRTAWPTTGLDPRSRDEVSEIVRAMAASGTTVLLTTQYLDEADRPPTASATECLGLLLGFRPGGGGVGVVLGVLLLLVFAFALGGIRTFLGLVLRTSGSVTGVITPIISGSNIFVDPATMPGRLQSLVEVDPVLHLVVAARALTAGADPVAELVLTLVWATGLIAVVRDGDGVALPRRAVAGASAVVRAPDGAGPWLRDSGNPLLQPGVHTDGRLLRGSPQSQQPGSLDETERQEASTGALRDAEHEDRAVAFHSSGARPRDARLVLAGGDHQMVGLRADDDERPKER